MKIPKKATVRVRCDIKMSEFLNQEDVEWLEREGFTNDEIKNKIEEWLRENIWEYVPENKIRIEVE